mgnify:CR=1 FL=1
MKRIGKILGLGLAMGGLLMATSVSAQTEKGDWAQFGRYADANQRGSSWAIPSRMAGGRRTPHFL